MAIFNDKKILRKEIVERRNNIDIVKKSLTLHTM